MENNPHWEQSREQRERDRKKDGKVRNSQRKETATPGKVSPGEDKINPRNCQEKRRKKRRNGWS